MFCFLISNQKSTFTKIEILQVITSILNYENSRKHLSNRMYINNIIIWQHLFIWSSPSSPTATHTHAHIHTCRHPTLPGHTLRIPRVRLVVGEVEGKIWEARQLTFVSGFGVAHITHTHRHCVSVRRAHSPFACALAYASVLVQSMWHSVCVCQ